MHLSAILIIYLSFEKSNKKIEEKCTPPTKRPKRGYNRNELRLARGGG
jgi:hypothetical protein